MEATDGFESSRLPYSRDFIKAFFECICCFGFLAAALFVFFFVMVCALLAWNDTDEVRKNCPGFWEYSLVALLSPLIIPAVYCVYCCCCLFVLGFWNWYAYSGACMLVMAIAGLHMSITSAENWNCVVALKSSTPSSPLPWLLYACWLKCVLFFSGAFSSLYYFFYSLQERRRSRIYSADDSGSGSGSGESDFSVVSLFLKYAFGSSIRNTRGGSV